MILSKFLSEVGRFFLTGNFSYQNNPFVYEVMKFPKPLIPKLKALRRKPVVNTTLPFLGYSLYKGHSQRSEQDTCYTEISDKASLEIV